MTQDRPLKDRYSEESTAFCDQLYETHSRYGGRTIERGLPLPGWHSRASHELRELNHAYERFWEQGGTGHRFYEEQRKAGNHNVLRLLQNDNEAMYEGLKAFHDSLVPSWVKLDLPLRRIAQPAVVVEQRPKQGMDYLLSYVLGDPLSYSIQRPATLVSHMGNEGGVKHRQLIVHKLPRQGG